MWHKALWMRNYKQGKLAFWLLVATSLFTLPIVHLLASNLLSNRVNSLRYSYYYEFDYGPVLWPLGGLVILLACQVVNGHHEDFLLSFPFKRRDLFLSKWLFGAVFIFGMTILNLFLMFLVHITTIHGQYLTFQPFLPFFLFMFIALLAVYSLSLMFGAMAGKMTVQGAFILIACFFPVGIVRVLGMPLAWHEQTRLIAFRLERLHDFLAEISIYSIRNPKFFMSQYTSDADAITVHHLALPSLTTYLALVFYIGGGLLLGLYLYRKFPSEHLGKVIIHKRLELFWLWGTALCMGIFGTEFFVTLFPGNPLLGQLIGFFIFAGMTYFVLSRFTHRKVSLKSRRGHQQVI